MTTRSIAVVLQEIADAIALAREAAAAVPSFNHFSQDRVRRAAVERALEIISEAARRLPDTLVDRHPGLPWAEIKAIGNKLRHEYHRVEPKIIWDVIAQDLDALDAVVRAELDLLS